MVDRAAALLLWLIAALGVLLAITAGLAAALIAPRSRYNRNLLIAEDQATNAVIGGDPDETISSRAGKRRHTCPVCDGLCRLLGRLDPDHCRNSIEADEGADAVIP